MENNEGRILSETVRQFFNDVRYSNETRERITEDYMKKVYGNDWQQQEADYLQQQEAAKEATQTSEPDEYDLQTISEMEDVLTESGNEAEFLQTYEDNGYDTTEDDFQRLYKYAQERYKEKIDPEYKIYKTLSEADKRALEGLQKAQPQANWTAAKYKQMMG